ncbi:hypothetical protein LIER_43854 [Lithospermum erythrorhizon]|uniref:Uncharacterized protein n=1 Tax=Lithospermum erythrorhizon TaxID=34254 RepID=A0AAV3R3N6_LITER
MTGIQFYFYDHQHQASNRMNTLPRLDTSIVENLVEIRDLTRELTTNQHALKLLECGWKMSLMMVANLSSETSGYTRNPEEAMEHNTTMTVMIRYNMC